MKEEENKKEEPKVEEITDEEAKKIEEDNQIKESTKDGKSLEDTLLN